MNGSADDHDVELSCPRQTAGFKATSNIPEQDNILPDMDAIIYSRIQKELGGKLIGRNTFVRDEQQKKKATGCLGQTFLCKGYHKLVIDSRPNTTSRETRSQQWSAIHNPMRYFYMLFFYLGPPGYLIYNLRYPLSLVTFLTLLNAVYYTVTMYYPQLPLYGSTVLWDVFRMGSFLLSIIISLKISRIYDRFWAARQAFGKLGGNANAMMQLLVIYSGSIPNETMSELEKTNALDEFQRWLIVFPYALIMQLLALKELPNEARIHLGLKQIHLLESTAKPRKYVLMKLQKILHQFNLPMEKYLSIEKLLQDTESAAAECRRIKFTALPYSISQYCTGFLMIWSCVIPFGVDGAIEGSGKTTGVLSIWVAAAVMLLFCFMMLAVDEIANQLEDPFHSLPLFDSLRTAVDHLTAVRRDFDLLEKAESHG